MAVRVSQIYGNEPVLNIFEIQDDFRELESIKIKISENKPLKNGRDL